MSIKVAARRLRRLRDIQPIEQRLARLALDDSRHRSPTTYRSHALGTRRPTSGVRLRTGWSCALVVQPLQRTAAGQRRADDLLLAHGVDL